MSVYLRNKFDFWSVHGIMNTSGLLQSKRKGFTLTLVKSAFEHPRHMLKLTGKKIFTILRSKILFI